MRIGIYKVFIVVMLICGFLIVGCNVQLKKDVVETFDDGTPKLESFYTLTGENKEVIKEIQYYENGQKKCVGYFKNEKKDGMWVYWFENGKKWSEGYFLEGLRTGKAKVFHDNGKLFYEGTYLEGKKTGKWKFYNEDGNKVNEVTFENGKIIHQTNENIEVDE